MDSASPARLFPKFAREVQSSFGVKQEREARLYLEFIWSVPAVSGLILTPLSAFRGSYHALGALRLVINISNSLHSEKMTPLIILIR